MPIILTVVVVRCGPPQTELNQQRTRPETGGWSGAGGAGPGGAWQSVQSSLKNIYGMAVFRLPGLAAVVQSRAGLKTDGTDDCEACSTQPSPTNIVAQLPAVVIPGHNPPRPAKQSKRFVGPVE